MGTIPGVCTAFQCAIIAKRKTLCELHASKVTSVSCSSFLFVCVCYLVLYGHSHSDGRLRVTVVFSFGFPTDQGGRGRAYVFFASDKFFSKPW